MTNLLNVSVDRCAPNWIGALKDIEQRFVDGAATADDYQLVFKAILIGLREEVRGSLSTCKPGGSRTMVARHEAAHVVVAMANDLPPVYAFIGDFGGITALDVDAHVWGVGSMAMSLAGMVSDGNGYLGKEDALIFGLSFILSQDEKSYLSYRPGSIRAAFDSARFAAALALREHAPAHRKIARALVASGEIGARAIRQLAGPSLVRGLRASGSADFDTATSSAYYAANAQKARSLTGGGQGRTKLAKVANGAGDGYTDDRTRLRGQPDPPREARNRAGVHGCRARRRAVAISPTERRCRVHRTRLRVPAARSIPLSELSRQHRGRQLSGHPRLAKVGHHPLTGIATRRPPRHHENTATI